MDDLKILTYPDDFLTTIAKQITNIDGSTQEIIGKMADIMYEAPGVGLAAIQVGIDQSMIIYDVSHPDEDRKLDVLINPKIIEKEGSVLSEKEGCLSVPDYRADVKRATSILVEGVDRDGNPLRFEAHGFPAIVLQHEIDHLNGTLFIDHISALKRRLYKKRVLKELKNRE
ncbi:MAG: peptide deformylase [Desulfobacterales bacterium]|nr:peptide deformylase [Desulfobacterales bacterium]